MWTHLRIAVRSLASTPRAAALVVLTLALGIGTNAIVFSFARPFINPPLPFEAPDEVVILWSTNTTRQIAQNPISTGDYLAWKSTASSFADMTACVPVRYNFGSDEQLDPVRGFRVTGSYFQTLRVRPVLGRMLTEEDDQPGSQSAVVSFGFWQRRLGGSAEVIGSTIKLDDQNFTVVGVAPKEFWFPSATDVWTPLVLERGALEHDRRFLFVLGRLKDSVGAVGAQAEMDAIASQLAADYPQTNTGWSVRVRRVSDEILNKDTAFALTALTLAVMFVLLIACVNVANLMMSRAEARENQMAIRLALGAGRARVLLQSMAESAVLSIAGAGLGSFLAWGGLRYVRGLRDDPLVQGIGLDMPAMIFIAALAIFATLVFGTLPVAHFLRTAAFATIKDGTRTSISRGRRRFARAIVVVELALVLPLLVAAGLGMRTLMGLQHIDWGFEPRGVLTMQLHAPQERFANDAQLQTLYQDLLTQFGGVAVVEHAALATRLPQIGPRGRSTTAMSIEGRPVSFNDEMPWAAYSAITADYYSVLGLDIRRGRAFTAQEVAQRAPVGVISEAMAERYWPGTDPIGQRIALTEKGSPCATCPIIPEQRSGEWLTIVGVVQDVRGEDPRTPPVPYLYFPLTRFANPDVVVLLRTRTPPLAAVKAVRAAAMATDARLQLFEIQPLEQVITDTIGPVDVFVKLLVVFGSLASALAFIGVYGLVSYSVSRRTRELGVRVAFGATPTGIRRMVLTESLMLLLIGGIVGLVLAIGLAQLMAAMLFGVSPLDPPTFVIGTAILCIFVSLASYLPAWRASRLDLVSALRYE